MNYNYFRTYDPATGRYVENDPVGLQGGLNTYGYVGQNPLGFIDPYGLIVTGDWIKSPKFNITDYRLTGAEFISPCGSALTALLDILKEVEAHGGDKVQWLYMLGPTAICQGTK